MLSTGLSFTATPLFAPRVPSGGGPASGGTIDGLADRILDLGSDFLNRRQDREDLRLAAQLNRSQALTNDQVLAFAARLNQQNGAIAPAAAAPSGGGLGGNSNLLVIAAIGLGVIALMR